MAMTADAFIDLKDRTWRDEARSIQMKDRGRQGSYTWKRQAWTFMQQGNMPDKVFVVERLERLSTVGRLTHTHHRIGDIEYRIGYFIVGRIGRANDRWVWGQFCPLIPAEDLEPLLAKARQEGTILPVRSN
jgi:hypothetical protein